MQLSGGVFGKIQAEFCNKPENVATASCASFFAKNPTLKAPPQPPSAAPVPGEITPEIQAEILTQCATDELKNTPACIELVGGKKSPVVLYAGAGLLAAFLFFRSRKNAT
jgi:hypothetical protein